jgi:hypothetical protein
MLPWFIRSQLGQVGALVTATFFAASPLFATVSRTASGNAIALFAVMLLFVSFLRLPYQAGKGWLYALGAALGLGLTSSPLFYSGMVVIAMAYLVQRLVSPEAKLERKLDRAAIIKVAIMGGLIMVALSTRLFTNLSGFGAAAQIFGDWLAQFTLRGDLQALLGPFLILGRYEIILLPLGIVAIIWAVWRNDPLGTLLTYWLFAAMILMLLQRGVLNNTLLLPLAGYMLLGLVTNHLLQRGTNRWTWAASGLIILAGAIVLVNFARFLRVSQVEEQVSNLWISLMAIAAAILFIYYFWSGQQKPIMQGIWLGIMTLLFLYQWGTAWNLTHVSANDPRESWVDEATDDDVRQLTSTLQDISRRVNNSDGGVPIFSVVDTPVLRWYLRDFGQAQFGHTLPLGAQYEVIITPATVSEPALGDDYLGGDFGLLRGKTEEVYLSPTPLLDALRWGLFHESLRGVVEERVILWVRSDLVQNPVR